MQYKVSGIIIMGALAFAALGLYLVKYWVQDVQQDVSTVELALNKEKESLHLLNAEWAYLNRPERLKALSEKYLNLTPLKSTQFISFNALPEAELNATQAIGEEAPREINAEIVPDSGFFRPVGAR